MLPYPVAHARSATIKAAAAVAEAKHTSKLKRLYVATPLRYIDHVSTLPFSLPVNQSEAAPQLVRTTNSCLSSIFRLCDERNSESLGSTTWISGREYPLRRCFERAITPDTPTTSALTTLMDELFGQVARALRDRAPEPEAFALFLRLLSGHFDRVDLGAGYKTLYAFVCRTGPLLAKLVQNVAWLSRQRQAPSVLLPQGLVMIWKWFGW